MIVDCFKCQKVQNAGIILQLDNSQKDEMATLPYTMLPAVFLKRVEFIMNVSVNKRSNLLILFEVLFNGSLLENVILLFTSRT